jgi:GDP-4-dehydro-6-deoxy-D-mannose reductase
VRVLIVGATGFVGRHLVRECLSRRDEVWGTFRPDETPPAGGGARWLPLDLLDGPSVDAALAEARPEGLVHLAGQASVTEAGRDPVGTFRVNAEGTCRVLAAMRERAPEAAAVVVTSAEVYGAVPPGEMPVAESRPLRPRTPYGASKAAADLVAAQAAEGWGLRVVRARPFNHVGPGQRLGFVAPDFASQVAAIESGTAPPEVRVGNLSGRRDFTDVRDVARGYRDALRSGEAGAAYNFCSGRSVPIGDILAFFAGRSRVPIRIREDPERLRAVDVPEFRGDPSRAARELGWSARIPLEESLREVLEEWRERAAAAPH